MTQSLFPFVELPYWKRPIPTERSDALPVRPLFGKQGTLPRPVFFLRLLHGISHASYIQRHKMRSTERPRLLYANLRYGVHLSKARPDLAIQHAHLPILLIHGTADNETSPEHSRRLAEANPAFTKLWLVPGAKHTGAYGTAPKEFEAQVLQWFRQARTRSREGN